MQKKQCISGVSLDSSVCVGDMQPVGALEYCEDILGGVRTTCLSADATSAISGSTDKTARFWNIKTGESIRVLQLHNSVYSVCLSRTKQRVIAGVAFEGSHLFDESTGKCIQTFRPPTCLRGRVLTKHGEISDADTRVYQRLTSECLSDDARWIVSA